MTMIYFRYLSIQGSSIILLNQLQSHTLTVKAKTTFLIEDQHSNNKPMQQTKIFSEK